MSLLLRENGRTPAASVVSANLVSHVLLVSHVNQLVHLCLFFLLSILNSQRCPPEGIPGSNCVWTPVLLWFYFHLYMWVVHWGLAAEALLEGLGLPL